MARLGITYVEVANAAAQLSALGKSPTIEAIRSITGTGSNSTLATHLKAWREHQLHGGTPGNSEHLPEELLGITKGLWQRLMAEAEMKIARLQQEWEDKLTAVKTELELSQSALLQLQQNRQQLREEKMGLESDKLGLEEMLKQQHTENNALKITHEKIELQLNEKQHRIEELQRLHQQVQTNLEHYREASAAERLREQQRHETAQQQLEQRLLQEKTECLQLREEKSTLQQHLQQFELELQHSKRALGKEEMQQQTLTNRIQELIQELVAKTQSEKQSQTQCESLQNKFEEQTAVNHIVEKQLAVIQQQLILEKHQREEAQQQNRILTQEKWELAQEKAQLLGQLKQLEMHP